METERRAQRTEAGGKQPAARYRAPTAVRCLSVWGNYGVPLRGKTPCIPIHSFFLESRNPGDHPTAIVARTLACLSVAHCRRCAGYVTPSGSHTAHSVFSTGTVPILWLGCAHRQHKRGRDSLCHGDTRPHLFTYHTDPLCPGNRWFTAQHRKQPQPQDSPGSVLSFWAGPMCVSGPGCGSAIAHGFAQRVYCHCWIWVRTKNCLAFWFRNRYNKNHASSHAPIGEHASPSNNFV